MEPTIDTVWASISVAYGLSLLVVLIAWLYSVVSIKRRFAWSWHRTVRKLSRKNLLFSMLVLPLFVATAATLFLVVVIRLASII